MYLLQNVALKDKVPFFYLWVCGLMVSLKDGNRFLSTSLPLSLSPFLTPFLTPFLPPSLPPLLPSSLPLSKSFQNGLTAIDVAAAKRDSKSRQRRWNKRQDIQDRSKVYATSSRGTHRNLLLYPIMWGWLAPNVCLPPPQLHVHVIQDDGGTDQLSSQDRPASDISVTQDRSTTSSEDQDSPTKPSGHYWPGQCSPSSSGAS